jgi:hypothetical protein
MEGPFRIWLAKRFRPHRLMGLFYLLQFSTLLTLMVGAWAFDTDKQTFELRRKLSVALPVTGFMQACVAARTFTNLPRTGGMVQGYFTNKRTMSYDWIQENIFFSGLLMFQVLYFNAPSFGCKVPFAVELIFVFFPYFTLRRLVPKTSLRRSMESKTETSEDIRGFMVAQIKVVKVFYVFAKWATGFFINYLIFIRAFTPEQPDIEFLMQTLWLVGGWGTTVAMFLHTLKYRGYIGPVLSILLYTGSFPFFVLSSVSLMYIARGYQTVAALACIGLMCNFGSPKLQAGVQVLAMMVLFGMRNGLTMVFTDA